MLFAFLTRVIFKDVSGFVTGCLCVVWYADLPIPAPADVGSFCESILLLVCKCDI